MSTRSVRVYSHSGCLRCRQRRKKCDEVHPICTNCRRNGLNCLWSGKNEAKFYLPVNTALSKVDAIVRTRNETCVYAFDMPSISSPYDALSPGHTSIRSETEKMLLDKLSTFLIMLSPSKADLITMSNNHVFSVGIAETWVRDALVAFAAFAFSARDSNLRPVSYRAYQQAISQVQKKIRHCDWFEHRDELLIASLFLGMIEVSNPENAVFPLLHFEAVGHLLAGVQWERSSEATKIFYHVAIESYIYHVAILAMFYPQTNRYARISPEIETILLNNSSGPEANMIISIDIRIYLILFELTVLGRADRSQPDFAVRLEIVRTRLRGLLDRATITPIVPATALVDGFWKLTHTAALILQIFYTKVKDPSILATADYIKENVGAATKALSAVVMTRAWTGNFVWIITILLCAASTPRDVQLIDDKIDEIKQGLWGSDLLRLQQVIRVVQQKRKQLDRFLVQNDNIINPEDYDTLSILLNKNGILG